MFAMIRASAAEVAAERPGNDIGPRADVVMDRAFTVPGEPATVWPWIVQLGKWRAGWYLPRRVERFIPRGRRAIRVIEPRWQDPQIGDLIPDYGGRHETFEVAIVDAPVTLVYRSQRGRVQLTWAITLTAAASGRTRVHLRLRLGPVRRVWLARSAGGFVDALTIAGLAAGLDERLS